MSETFVRPIAADHPGDWIVAIAEHRDRESFIALFTSFAPKVKGYLLRHGLAEQVAEDLAQETLLAVWRKAEQFDPMRASAGAWIYTIARNLRVDLLRRELHPDDGCIGEMPIAQPTPEDELKALEAEKRLRAAIETLPREQAQVLQLSYFEERTHSEIASRLGLPLGTVKSRIRLASTHLRSALGGFA